MSVLSLVRQMDKLTNRCFQRTDLFRGKIDRQIFFKNLKMLQKPVEHFESSQMFNSKASIHT